MQANLLKKQLGLLHPLKFRVQHFKTKQYHALRVTLLGGSLSPSDHRMLHWRLESLIPALNRLSEGCSPIDTILLVYAQQLPRLDLPSAV